VEVDILSSWCSMVSFLQSNTPRCKFFFTLDFGFGFVLSLCCGISPAMTARTMERSRSPLIPRIASSMTSSASTQLTSSVPNNVHQQHLRRKQSLIGRLVDSSESVPSPHSSIYEATYCPTDSSESNNRFELRVPLTLKLVPHNAASHIRLQAISDENSPTSAPSPGQEFNATEFAAQTLDSIIGNTPIIYGKGTALETITEQKSNATLGPLIHTRSCSAVTASHLAHQSSRELAQTLQRRGSFSVDDLAVANHSYHEAIALIEHTARRPLPIHDIYASPRTPTHPPPHRPPTPPGLPSWTAAQEAAARDSANRQSRRRRPQSSGRISRFWQREFGNISHSSRLPSSSTPSPFSSGPTRINRFRVPRSAYSNISSHPFTRAASIKLSNTVAPPPVESSQPSRVHSTPRIVSNSNHTRNTITNPAATMGSSSSTPARCSAHFVPLDQPTHPSVSHRLSVIMVTTEPATSAVFDRTNTNTVVIEANPIVPRCWKCRTLELRRCIKEWGCFGCIDRDDGVPGLAAPEFTQPESTVQLSFFTRN
jgi:hypothetical protein